MASADELNSETFPTLSTVVFDRHCFVTSLVERMPSLFPNTSFQLPGYRSLLVVGKYHASAPIHLAISHVTENPNSYPVILSPSRDTLKNALKGLNDDWIASNARCGRTLDAVSRINMFYPPNPVHMSFLLSLLRTHKDDATSEPPEPWLNPKTNRTFPPGLIILHELSLYFANADELSPYTVSSYLNLLSRAFATVHSLCGAGSAEPPPIALFDSLLLELKLPITKVPTDTYNYQLRWSDREPVYGLAEKFFEWVALFQSAEEEDTVPSSQGEEDALDNLRVPRKQMRLYPVRTGEEEHIFTWEEVLRTGSRNTVSTTYLKL